MSEIKTQLEEVEICGELYQLDITVPYEGEIVDNGIGPYEFWGSKGTDVRMETEIDWKVEDIEVDKITDDNARVIEFDPEFVKEALDKFFDGGENSRWYTDFITGLCEEDFEE
jgi:hypothetical protein